MKKIRDKLTYANVMATIAVFLAVAGGSAFAATQMLPKASVDTKQLAKESVTPAKLSKASKKALTGAIGPKGATGATGPQGPKGEQGEGGPIVQTLPVGKTERGAWGLSSTRSGSHNGGAVASFPIPLANEPTAHIILSSGAPTSACPGTNFNPQAAPGNLCVYGGYESFPFEVVPLTLGGGLRFGFFYLIEANPGSDYEDYGTWAVTAG